MTPSKHRQTEINISEHLQAQEKCIVKNCVPSPSDLFTVTFVLKSFDGLSGTSLGQ
jgi:hypothetical protein